MGLQRAYYHRPVAEFLAGNPDQILGELARIHGHALEIPQRQAWLDEISILKGQLVGLLHVEQHVEMFHIHGATLRE